jgi:hypothetical protein
MDKNFHVGFSVLKVIGEALFLYGTFGWIYGVLVQITHPQWLPEGLSHLMPWIRIDTFAALSFVLSIIGFLVWRLSKETVQFRTHAAAGDSLRAKPFPWNIVVAVLVGMLFGALIVGAAVLVVPRPINPNTLFSDGFEPPETSSFQNWSGIVKSPGCTVEIQNSVVYAGTAAEHSILIAGQTYAFIYANLVSAVSSAFGSCYIYVRSGPSVNGDTCFLFGLSSAPQVSQVGVGLIYTGGALRWWMDCEDSSILDIVNSTVVSLNQWYSVEVSTVVASGTGSSVFFLDGVQVGSETGLNNWRVGNIAGVFLGIGCSSGPPSALEIYSDSVVVSTSYIPSQLAAS